MGVVQVIGRTDAHVVDALVLGPAPELFQVAIEALVLGEEADVEREAIEDADGVVRIGRRDERCRVANRAQVPGATKPPTPRIKTRSSSALIVDRGHASVGDAPGARPSQSSGIDRPCAVRRKWPPPRAASPWSRADELIRPTVTVTGRSVFSHREARRTRNVVSSWTPPESVMTTVACRWRPGCMRERVRRRTRCRCRRRTAASRLRACGWTGNTTGTLRDPPFSAEQPADHVGTSTFDGRCSVTERERPRPRAVLQRERPGSCSSAAGSSRTSVSIMALPTLMDAGSALFRRRVPSSPSRDGGNVGRARRSVARRLSPASTGRPIEAPPSTCPTRRPASHAATVAAIVEFTSP